MGGERSKKMINDKCNGCGADIRKKNYNPYNVIFDMYSPNRYCLDCAKKFVEDRKECLGGEWVIEKERKFYRTTITIEILSEEEIGDKSLSEINYEMQEGDYSGKIIKRKSEVVTSQEMAKLLIKQSSDPLFFG